MRWALLTSYTTSEEPNLSNVFCPFFTSFFNRFSSVQGRKVNKERSPIKGQLPEILLKMVLWMFYREDALEEAGQMKLLHTTA